MINDVIEGSGLELFHVMSRFVWVSLLSSQCPMFRASVSRKYDVLEGSDIALFQGNSRFLSVSLLRSQC
jgi:hypothetical protein